jgi:hypothetical protein
VKLEARQAKNDKVEAHGINEGSGYDLRVGLGDDTSSSGIPLGFEQDTLRTEDVNIGDITKRIEGCLPCMRRDQCPRMMATRGTTMYHF